MEKSDLEEHFAGFTESFEAVAAFFWGRDSFICNIINNFFDGSMSFFFDKLIKAAWDVVVCKICLFDFEGIQQTSDIEVKRNIRPFMSKLESVSKSSVHKESFKIMVDNEDILREVIG